MPIYLCRLSGPRPTFPADMTAEEGALMQEHAVYWMGQVREGVAIVFGPVLDPAGVWGAAVVEAADEAAARALTEVDPVIAANRGFRYDVLDMPRAVTRGQTATS
ncbi:MAG TPA: YciI family protein [Beijerinckiaceae bacterium]|jgi:uncharacterized protein YciI